MSLREVGDLAEQCDKLSLIALNNESLRRDLSLSIARKSVSIRRIE